MSVALRLNANTGEVFFPRLAFKIHTNRGKEIIEQKAVPAENDSFNIKVPVDTFVSAGLFGSHNCSRRLKDVEVVLLKKGLPVQTVQLGIGQDFDWDATWAEWRTKLPVVFNDSKGSLAKNGNQ